MGQGTGRISEAWLAGQYWFGAALLFIVLSVVLTIVLLSAAPVYTCRSTVRIGSQLPSALAGPAALLASDSTEDELAVLESQTVRDHVASQLHLACQPVPVWQPNPFMYQVQRVFSMLFGASAPLDYAKLAYPTVTQLEMDWDRAEGSSAIVSVDKAGNYSLIFNKAAGTAVPVGQPLSAHGLTVALTGFSPNVAQRWRLVLSDPDRIAIEMLDKLSVFRVGQRSQTVGVRYEAAHPELAANVVKAVMDYYMQRDIDITQQVSKESLVYIDQQVKQVDDELEQLRQQMLTLLKDRSNLLASGATPDVPSNYLKLEMQLGDLRTSRSQISSLLNQLNSDKGFLGYYDPGTGSRRLETDLVEQIMSIERALKSEMETKTEQHPRIQELRQQLDKLHADLGKLLKESIGQVDRQIASVQQQRGEFESLLALTPQASTELERLKGEIQIRSETLGALYGERQRAALQQISSVSAITMLDPAVPDRRHVRPRILQSVLTAGIFALLVTIAMLLAYRAIDPAVRSPRDLTGRFGAPVLATLDESGAGGRDIELSRLRHRVRHLLSEPGARLAVMTVGGEGRSEAVAALIRPMIGGAAPAAEGAGERIVAAPGSGIAALYSDATSDIASVVIATRPGPRRLTELSGLVSELNGAGHQLAGFILLRSRGGNNGGSQA